MANLGIALGAGVDEFNNQRKMAQQDDLAAMQKEQFGWQRDAQTQAQQVREAQQKVLAEADEMRKQYAADPFAATQSMVEKLNGSGWQGNMKGEVIRGMDGKVHVVAYKDGVRDGANSTRHEVTPEFFDQGLRDHTAYRMAAADPSKFMEHADKFEGRQLQRGALKLSQDDSEARGDYQDRALAQNDDHFSKNLLAQEAQRKAEAAYRSAALGLQAQGLRQAKELNPLQQEQLTTARRLREAGEGIAKTSGELATLAATLQQNPSDPIALRSSADLQEKLAQQKREYRMRGGDPANYSSGMRTKEQEAWDTKFAGSLDKLSAGMGKDDGPAWRAKLEQSAGAMSADRRFAGIVGSDHRMAANVTHAYAQLNELANKQNRPTMGIGGVAPVEGVTRQWQYVPDGTTFKYGQFVDKSTGQTVAESDVKNMPEQIKRLLYSEPQVMEYAQAKATVAAKQGAVPTPPAGLGAIRVNSLGSSQSEHQIAPGAKRLFEGLGSALDASDGYLVKRMDRNR